MLNFATSKKPVAAEVCFKVRPLLAEKNRKRKSPKVAENGLNHESAVYEWIERAFPSFIRSLRQQRRMMRFDQTICAPGDIAREMREKESASVRTGEEQCRPVET